MIYVATRSIRSKYIRTYSFICVCLCFLTSYPRLPVYIYRTVLDCENGVSSTRTTGIGAISLQEGEIRQIQFAEDDTMMVLWSNNGILRFEIYFVKITCVNDLQKDPLTSSTSPFSRHLLARPQGVLKVLVLSALRSMTVTRHHLRPLHPL